MLLFLSGLNECQLYQGFHRCMYQVSAPSPIFPTGPKFTKHNFYHNRGYKELNQVDRDRRLNMTTVYLTVAPKLQEKHLRRD